MNTDHKLGRSEAIRDASRAISAQIEQVNKDIIERYDFLDQSREKGQMLWAEDDPTMLNLKGRRDALYDAHSKVCNL